MPVLSDFTVIQGDVNRRVGDGATLWEKTFNTGGRHPGGQAILTLMVKGLTETNSDVDVKINNVSVGKIFHYKGANPNHWFSQTINIGGGILNNGDNELQLEAVTWPGATPNNLFDDFFLRDVVCFFQQAA